MLDYEKGNFACVNHAEISSYSQPVLSNVEFLAHGNSRIL